MHKGCADFKKGVQIPDATDKMKTFGGDFVLQDNQNSLVQFCRDFGITIDEILHNSNELLLFIEEFVDLYRPKTREEAGVFNRIRYKLPNSVHLLSDIQKNTIPDDIEFFDLFSSLKDVSLDVVSRMVSANVIINDIIKMYFEPHEDDMYIYLQLTMLKWSKNSIYDDKEKLYKIYKELSIQYPNLLVSDDDIEEEEETVLPGDVESFQYMEDILIKAFTRYLKDHETELYTDFFIAIQNYLKDFGNGIEPDNQFDFGFSLRNNTDELKYVDFHFESEMIEVTSGGSVYDEYVGSDSYTDWMYSIGLNAWVDYNYDCEFSEVLGLIRNGAELSIENPEEFAEYEEDEEDE